VRLYSSWRRTAIGDARQLETHGSWRRTVVGDARQLETHGCWRRTAVGDARQLETHGSASLLYDKSASISSTNPLKIKGLLK